MSVLLGNGHLFAEGLRSDLYFDKKKGSYWEKDLDPHWIVLGRSILRIYSKSIYRSSDDIGVPAKASGRSDTFCRRRNKTAWQISSVALGNCEEWFHEAARKSNKHVRIYFLTSNLILRLNVYQAVETSEANFPHIQTLHYIVFRYSMTCQVLQ